MLCNRKDLVSASSEALAPRGPSRGPQHARLFGFVRDGVEIDVLCGAVKAAIGH